MIRFSPGSVRKLVGGGIRHYRELQVAERVVYTTWSAALLATVLGLVGVNAYQFSATQPQHEACTVTALSPSYSTATGSQYRFVDTSCGKYQIRPGDQATSALEHDAPDSLALTGSVGSGVRYELTFEGWGSNRTLVGAMSH